MSEYIIDDETEVTEDLLDDVATQDDETTQDDVSPDATETQKIKIGDDEIDYDEVVNAYNNYKGDTDWKKANTAKAEEIAQQRRELEAERRQLLDEREKWVKSQQAPTQKSELEIPEEIADDPALVALFKKNHEMEERLNQVLKTTEDEKFLQSIEKQHGKLASKYEDYDAMTIEEAIQKNDPFEDAYLAGKYRAFKAGDKDAIISIIPEEVKKDFINQGKQAAIKEIREKAELRKQASSSQPTRQALASMPKGDPTNYREAHAQTLGELKERGMSLVQD